MRQIKAKLLCLGVVCVYYIPRGRPIINSVWFGIDNTGEEIALPASVAKEVHAVDEEHFDRQIMTWNLRTDTYVKLK